MATVNAARHSRAQEAASRAMKDDIARVLVGEESRFGARVEFIGSDLATAERIREDHAEGITVVIVDEHENVTVLPAPDPSLGERERERFWSELLAHW